MGSFRQFFIIAGVFLLLCYPVFIFFTPIKIEIIPVETGIQAYIYKKTMLNPFNKEFIPNLKQAVITKSTKGRYIVELEDFQGQRFPVTSYKHSGYESVIKLQNQINNSIKNKTYLKYKISSPYMIAIILFFALSFFYKSKEWFYGDNADEGY